MADIPTQICRTIAPDDDDHIESTQGSGNDSETGSESESESDHVPEHDVSSHDSNSDVPRTTHDNNLEVSSDSDEPSVMVSEQNTNHQAQTRADHLGMDSANIVLSTYPGPPAAVATNTTPPHPNHIHVAPVTPETECGIVAAYHTGRNAETETTAAELQREPGRTETETVPEAPIRAQRVRKARVIDLKECDCGREVSQEEIAAGDLVIRCKVPGCETVWVSIDVIFWLSNS
jgi:hypothetical protein